MTVNIAALLGDQFRDVTVTAVDIYTESGRYYRTVTRAEFEAAYAPWLLDHAGKPF